MIFRHCFTLILFLSYNALMAQSPRTELQIHLVDESDQAVEISRAELYLDYWGSGEKVTLPHDKSGVTVQLDRSWLCDSRPGRCQDQSVEGRVILQADGYAPVVSHLIPWLGGIKSSEVYPQETTEVEIEFPNSAGMHLKAGESKNMTVRLRRPTARTLRFVDQNGELVPGVSVGASLLLATSNHCGGTEGEPFAQGTSGDNGEVLIPDADAEYALQFGKAHYVLPKSEDSDHPMRLFIELKESLTIVPLRGLQSQPLSIQITDGVKPLPGIAVTQCASACLCGACCGQLGVSDASGRVDVKDYYPEEFDRLMVLDKTGLNVLWQQDPSKLTNTHPIVVQLPATSPTLTAPVPPEQPPKN